MAGLFIGRAVATGMALAGFGLMSVAMFLHPMSPEDFLSLVLSDPMLTLTDAQGATVAVFFWLGALTFLVGTINLAGQLARLCRNLLAHGTLKHA